MTVTHPLADRDASPAAVTVGTTTYPVGDEGEWAFVQLHVSAPHDD